MKTIFIEGDETFDLRKVLLLLWRYKWLIFNITAVTLAGASLYAFRLNDVYTTSAQVFVEDVPSPILRAQTDEIAFRAMSEKYVPANIALMKSKPVVTRVAEQLGLAEKMSAKERRSVSLDQAASRVAGALKISYDKSIYTLEATTSDPFLAAGIANTAAKEFLKEYLRSRLYLSKEIQELFPVQATDLAKYTSQGQLEDLSRREIVAQLPSVRSDPTVKALEEKKYLIETEIARLAMRYKEKHPKMIEARANLYFTNERLKARVDEIVSELKEKLVTKFQESNVRILNEAGVPGSPSGPDRPRMILMAGLVALFLSIALVVLLDSLDDKINNEDDIGQSIRLPYLGAVFKIKKVKDDLVRDAYLLHEPLSETAEAFKNLRVNINFATALEHRKTLLITSALPEEGKTFVACNLAVSKAQDGKKVLLVDADLRRPKIHKVFGLENTSGLSNLLTAGLSYEGVLQHTQLENLDVITSGPPSPNPPELFSARAMQDFIAAVTKAYEIVVFDSPPAYHIPDVLVLGMVLGGVVLVVQAHKTSYKVILKTKEHITEKGVRIIGALLNNLEVSKEKAPYYHHYYAHGYTYSAKKGES